MTLSAEVMAFLAKARQSPAYASDPTLLDALERAATTSSDGAFAALHAPVAQETWEARALILGAQQESMRVPMRIPFASEIVGFYPVAKALGTGGGTTPDLNDIDVSIDLDLKEYLTSARGVTVPGSNALDGTFVTLGALAVQTPRLIRLALAGKSTDLGVTYRWKRGAGVHQDTLVTLGLFMRPLGR